MAWPVFLSTPGRGSRFFSPEVPLFSMGFRGAIPSASFVSDEALSVADDRFLFVCMGMPSLLAFSQDTLAGSVELSVPLSAFRLRDRPLVAAFGVAFLAVR